MNFTIDDNRFGENFGIDLKPGGKDITVTEENKHEYIEYNEFVTFCFTISRLVTQWKIVGRIQDQFNAFMEGFHQLIPADLIGVFDERELELLIGGISEIDVDDWKRHTDYRGYTEQDEVIQWFWNTRCSCRELQ